MHEGIIVIQFADGTCRELKIRTNKAIESVSLTQRKDTSPWDYDDPDGDGVFYQSRDTLLSRLSTVMKELGRG